MDLAVQVSKAGTCDRLQVGAVLVKNGAIIGTGYNGSARGDLSCDQEGHVMKDGHCVRTIHAEENAVLNAARNNGGTLGSILFCTHEPCYRCIQRLINAGVEAVYFALPYRKPDHNREKLIHQCQFEVKAL